MTDDDRAAEIVGRCREALARGEAVDLDAVVREHPDLADALRGPLAALDRVRRAFVRDAPQVPPFVGRRLGPYRVEAALGTGGMGSVFLAVRDDGGARVALKVVHPHLLEREGFLRRFLREAELGRRVRHANVVATIDADACEVDGRPTHFLVMEHVEGRTLRALLEDLGRVPEELCRHVGREVARALAAIHAAGAVHRDLKPENVIVTPDHAVKVMDLGAARLLDESMRISQTGAFVGSVRYAAPEQFGLARASGASEAIPRSPGRAKGDDVDGRADLYALGLTLYELATGRHPFSGEDFRAVVRQQMTEVPRPAGEVNPQLSAFFEELLRRLLAKDRGARFASAEELLRALEDGEESAWWRDRSREMRRETRRPLRRIRIPRETALYGRDAEMARLRSLYDRAKAGDGQVVLVEGEAGIGKSRLVDEFVLSLWGAGEDIDFLLGSYPPAGAATASGAFSTAYRSHLGDDEEAIRAALPETPLLVPAFAALLRGDVAPEGAEKLTKDSLQTVFVHATRSFAARRTTIVLIDDLHFAPEEGRALFASIALAVPGHRILLVGGARPTLDVQWVAQFDRLGHATRVPVPRLTAKDLVLLLRDTLKSQHLAEELAGKIGVKSDGNPFFVFEILRGLREGQFITKRSDGTWATTKEIREIQVPSSVVELVQARVSDLGRSDRNVLEVAACVGFEFDPALVGDVLGIARIPLLQALGAIEKSHRLVRSAGRRFVFDHHQVMEVLYAGLSEPLREEYHAAIGTALETRSGAASKDSSSLDGALCVDLAEHLLRGAQGPRALRYLDAALTHLEKGWLNEAAARLADRALAVPGLVEGGSRCELLMRKAGRLDLLGRRDEEAKSLQEANSLADATGDLGLKSRARRELGRQRNATSNYAEAECLFAEGLAISREAGDTRGEAYATWHLAQVFDSLGRFAEANAHYERSLALARDIGDRRLEAVVTGRSVQAFVSLGRFAEAQAQYDRSIVLAREIGDRRAECQATGNLGSVLWNLGRLAEAQAQYERDLEISREIGDRRSETAAIGNLGAAFWSLGRLAEAAAQIERSLALAREIGDRQGEGYALVNLGQTWLDLGDGRRAREALVASLALCREIGARYLEGFALFALGSVADEECDAVRALSHTEDSLALRRRIGHADEVAESLVAIGDLRRRGGDLDGARAALGEGAALSRELGMKKDLALALTIFACLPGGDVRAAEAALAEAGDAGRSPRASFLLWQATGLRSHLALAKQLLDELLAKNPPEYRESMLTNVRLHREIMDAVKALGS